MRIHGVQFNIKWEDKAANFERIGKRVAEADVKPGDLVVLPEMFATGFSMNAASIAEEPDTLTETFLKDLAKKHQAYVVGGLVGRGRKDAGKGRNEAITCDPKGAQQALYTKRHPFSFANEPEFYEPGDAFVTFGWNGFTASTFICYDLRFPETFRRTVSMGVNLYIVIANWPRPRREHWMALLTARAIENQAVVIGVNRCGSDPKNEYAGDSRIVGPRGEILAAALDEEAVISAEPDLKDLEAYREQFPALQDMRDL